MFTLSGKKRIINIAEFEAVGQEGFKESLQEMGVLGMELFPLQIGDNTYYIDKNGLIENREVFKAICNGYNIDLSATKDEKGESKFIDL